jgi:transposase
MTLSHAEDGFRALKSDLGLRPIRHHGERRCKAHILVSVLAYHLLQFITHTLATAGDKRSWSTIRRVLSTHAYTTIIMPTITGITHRIRKAGTPDQAQAQIYQHLAIDWRLLPTNHTTA